MQTLVRFMTHGSIVSEGFLHGAADTAANTQPG